MVLKCCYAFDLVRDERPQNLRIMDSLSLQSEQAMPKEEGEVR